MIFEVKLCCDGKCPPPKWFIANMSMGIGLSKFGSTWVPTIQLALSDSYRSGALCTKYGLFMWRLETIINFIMKSLQIAVRMNTNDATLSI